MAPMWVNITPEVFQEIQEDWINVDFLSQLDQAILQAKTIKTLCYSRDMYGGNFFPSLACAMETKLIVV